MSDEMGVYAVYYLLSRGLLVWAEFLWVWATRRAGTGPQMNETPQQWLRATAVALLPLAGDVFICFYAAVWLAWFAGQRRQAPTSAG